MILLIPTPCLSSNISQKKTSYTPSSSIIATMATDECKSTYECNGTYIPSISLDYAEVSAAFEKCKVELVAYLPSSLYEALGKDFITHFHRHTTSSFVCMMKGKSDFALLKHAKDSKCPRGWYIIFSSAGKLIRMSGFFPKFSNEERQVTFDLTNLGDSFTISLKVSGQLMMVTIVNSVLEIFGKNSYHTPATEEFKTFFMAWLDKHPKKEGIIAMLEKQTMCVETILMSDVMHGYATKDSNYFYVTAISNNITSDSADGDRISWLNAKEFNAVCAALDLPRSWSITVSGTTAVALMAELDANRDRMTFTFLNSILGKHGFEPVDPALHCGGIEALEGFVITGDNGHRIKYKFPVYTFRTMLLRMMFARDGLTGLAELCSTEFTIALADFVDRWVVSAAGKAHWTKVGHAIANLMSKKEFHAKVIEGPAISLHLRIMDKLEEMGIDLFDDAAVNKLAAGFSTVLTKPILFVVTGFVGTGKSYFASHHGGVHIDGDNVKYLPNTIMGGAERNDATIYAVAQAFADGDQVVTLSCGGGVCMGGSRKNPQVVINKKLRKLLGWTPSIVMLEMSRTLTLAGGNVCKFKTNPELADTLESLGNVKEYTDTVVAARGEEAKLAGIYVSVIKSNVGIVSKLRKVFTTYLVPAYVYGKPVPELDLTLLAKIAVKAKPQPCKLRAQQVRLVAMYEGGRLGHTCGHFTCDYSQKGRTADYKAATALRKSLKKNLEVTRVKLTSVVKTGRKFDKMEFLYTQDKQLAEVMNGRVPHVTINSGPFQPMATDAAVKAMLAEEAGAFDVTGPARQGGAARTIKFKVTSTAKEVITLGGVILL